MKQAQGDTVISVNYIRYINGTIREGHLQPLSSLFGYLAVCSLTATIYFSPGFCMSHRRLIFRLHYDNHRIVPEGQMVRFAYRFQTGLTSKLCLCSTHEGVLECRTPHYDAQLGISTRTSRCRYRCLHVARGQRVAASATIVPSKEHGVHHDADG